VLKEWLKLTCSPLPFFKSRERRGEKAWNAVFAAAFLRQPAFAAWFLDQLVGDFKDNWLCGLLLRCNDYHARSAMVELCAAAVKSLAPFEEPLLASSRCTQVFFFFKPSPTR